MRARAVWRFFPARAEGDRDDPPLSGERAPAASGTARGRTRSDGLCLTDYVLAGRPRGALRHHRRRRRARAGRGVEEPASISRATPSPALALETAEAAAEWLHAQLRARLGLPRPAGDLRWRTASPPATAASATASATPPAPTSRSSASCSPPCGRRRSASSSPKGDMMDPEASVSALVFQHPDARYFGV